MRAWAVDLHLGKHIELDAVTVDKGANLCRCAGLLLCERTVATIAPRSHEWAGRRCGRSCQAQEKVEERMCGHETVR